MKVNFISNGAGFRERENRMRSAAAAPGAEERRSVCADRQKSGLKNKYDNINTSIKNNSDARVSFKGSIHKPLLDRCAEFAKHNPIAADALLVLPITCLLKPFTLLSMSKTEDEKKKYYYQAAKAIASGLAGFGMALAAGSVLKSSIKLAKKQDAFVMPEALKKKSQSIIDTGIQALKTVKEKIAGNEASAPLSDRIEKLTENGKLNISIFNNHFDKIDKKEINKFISGIEKVSPENTQAVRAAIEEQKSVNNYEDAAKNTADKLLQPIFLPLRTKVTYLAIPPLLAFLGFKKPVKSNNQKKPEAAEAASAVQVFKGLSSDLFQDKNSKTLFKPFLGGRK